MSVLLEFSMIPLDKGESMSKYVAKSLDIVDRSGVGYKFNSMGTVIEGSWDEVMAVLKKCYEAMSKDSNRISCHVKIDSRKNKENRLKLKVEKVESLLDRKLNQ
jgi:uncharacterized protein (TIGR00106 family)